MWKKAISYARFICISLFAFLLPTQLGKHFFLDFSFINGIRIDYLAPTIHVTDILALLIIALYPRLVYKLFNKRPLVYSIGIFILTIIFSHVPWLWFYSKD
jgi:hypothetical protein